MHFFLERDGFYNYIVLQAKSYCATRGYYMIITHAEVIFSTVIFIFMSSRYVASLKAYAFNIVWVCERRRYLGKVPVFIPDRDKKKQHNRNENIESNVNIRFSRDLLSDVLALLINWRFRIDWSIALFFFFGPGSAGSPISIDCRAITLYKYRAVNGETLRDA